MKKLRLESLYPRSVEAKLDKFLPRELPMDAFLNINGGYVGLVEEFRAKVGVVDDTFVLTADYHSSIQAPGEPDYDEFHTDYSNIQFGIDSSIRMLNMAFDDVGIPRRHRMPLINQMVATARLEAEM